MHVNCCINAISFALVQSFLSPFYAAELSGWAARQAERRLADGVTGAQRQAPTLSLSVQLHAPLLVIPAHSRSREALLVNLGELWDMRAGFP